MWVCVLGLRFWLRPATPGWGVGVCVSLCAHSACTLPLVAQLCAVGARAGARVSAAPRHSWLGCWGVCVLVCALRLCPATPCWGVRLGCLCLGSGFGCAPPLLAGASGCVCICVLAPLVPRHSWLGCAVWVCVLGLGFRLRPATPGWDVGVCVSLCAHSACNLPLVARLCAVGARAGARVSAAPRHPWLGCWGVCVLVCALRLCPATPCWGVRLGCLCLGLGFGCGRHSWLGCWGVCVLGARSACAPPLLAGVCGVGVCVWARVVAAPRLSWLGCRGVRVFVRVPLVPRHSWLGCALWVCVLGLGFRLRPATPGWVVGVYVCLCARSALLRRSWLGCAAWVRVLGLGSRLRPATLGWGVGVFLCLCGRSALAPPLLAGLCGVGVRAWARVSAALRHSWLGCWGVCVCWYACSACTPPLLAEVCGAGVRAWARVLAAPCHSWLGRQGVCVFVCLLRLYPATPCWGVRCGCACLGLGFGCALPLLAGVLGPVWVLSALRLYPATPPSDPPPYRPPPAAQTGGTAHALPPARPPAHERHGPAPQHAAPTGWQAKGTGSGPHTRTPAPTARR